MKILLVILFFIGCERLTSWNVPKGGDFTLHSTTGPVHTKDLRGKTVFIFFGFLQCPHVCPTTINELSRMAKTLNPVERERVRFLFVTVDPERDTSEKLKERFAGMGEFIPLTGTEAEIRKVLALFGGGYKVTRGKDPEDVFIDHTSQVFVINRKGQWVNSLDYDASSEELKRALETAGLKRPYWSEQARAERVKDLGGNEDCDLSHGPCDYIAPDGKKYVAEITPRPVKHLQPSRLTLRVKNPRLRPQHADFVGVELSMGLIRPKLVKLTDDTWVAPFRLPTCELKAMSWNLRLLLVNSARENHQIKFRFTSLNEIPSEPIRH